jgi:hypothetical protein
LVKIDMVLDLVTRKNTRWRTRWIFDLVFNLVFNLVFCETDLLASCIFRGPTTAHTATLEKSYIHPHTLSMRVLQHNLSTNSVLLISKWTSMPPFNVAITIWSVKVTLYTDYNSLLTCKRSDLALHYQYICLCLAARSFLG